MTTITQDAEQEMGYVSLQVRVPPDVAELVRVKAARTVGLKPRDVVVEALREYFEREEARTEGRKRRAS